MPSVPDVLALVPDDVNNSIDLFCLAHTLRFADEKGYKEVMMMVMLIGQVGSI